MASTLVPAVLPARPRQGSRLGPLEMLRRSLLHRGRRSLSALVALTVSAGVATALLTLYADLNQKLHREFRSFGANILISLPANPDTTPGTPDSLPSDALARVRQAAGPDALVAPFAYAVATTDRGTPVVVAGTDFAVVKQLDHWWQVDHWPSNPNDALIGVKAANFIADENALTLHFAGKPLLLHGAGHLKTGVDEDSRIYIGLNQFTAWTGSGASVLEVQVPGGALAVNAGLLRLHAALPGVQVSAVRALVEGESRIVDRTHALMFGAVLLIALTVGVSVLATLSASVLERRRDFALMKALGGSQRQLLGLFLLEASVLGLAGVAAGYVLGSALAFGISEWNFQTASLPRLSVLPLVLLLNATIALLAALLPARSLRTLEPAALLKGE